MTGALHRSASSDCRYHLLRPGSLHSFRLSHSERSDGAGCRNSCIPADSSVDCSVESVPYRCRDHRTSMADDGGESLDRVASLQHRCPSTSCARVPRRASCAQQCYALSCSARTLSRFRTCSDYSGSCAHDRTLASRRTDRLTLFS